MGVPPGLGSTMGASLRHRGPDSSGLLERPQVALAHRRLKIIDLSDSAAQPMSDESGRFHVAFNGEIYNFHQLRDDLSGRYSFFSNSDTEIILRMFQTYGIRALQDLKGMYALAIYDARENVLHLARDHAGIKPLYYAISGSYFFFGSEIKALLATGYFSGDPDPKAVSTYLQLGYIPAPQTIYKGICKLPQGCRIQIGPSGLTQEHRFWSMHTLTAKKQRKYSIDQQTKILTGRLESAVRSHMISDVPVGAFLSGGVDSSLLTAIMTRNSQDPIQTFTAGFPGMGYYDERPFARRVSELLGTEHHEFLVEDRVQDTVERLPSVFDEPFADSSAVPMYCLSHLTSKHVKVALSGTGGDEIFGGYRKYMAAYWLSSYLSLPKTIRDSIRKALAKLPTSRRSLWQERALLLQRFVNMESDEKSDLKLNFIFSQQELEALIDREEGLDFLPFQQSSTIPVENLMMFDFEYYLPEDLLLKEDRCTMAFGLEARVPFLDPDVIEFMAGLPLTSKVTATQTKRLLKKVASQYLPSWVVRRPKHGFGSPVAEWLRSDLKDLAEDLIHSPSAFLRSDLIRTKWKEHREGQTDHSRQLWAILMLELWHRSRILR